MNESRIDLTDRLRTEGRWAEASQFKDQELRKLRGGGMPKSEASESAWEAMAEKYPPLPDAETAAVSVQIQGLADIPASWGDLPGNASLQAELAWVQSNRLAVVFGQANGDTVVKLELARSPAPSWAALGWLETSILCYSKFVDVVAKSLKDEKDGQEHVRRERMAIDEIRELLAEMMSDSPEPWVGG